MADTTHRFDDRSDDYAIFRPSYGSSFIADLAKKVVSTRTDTSFLVVDIGSGTGIFTRQMTDALPEYMSVIGVEPSRPMREKAMETGRNRYVDGRAEMLPFDDSSVRVVCAATAAHWFDRPAFYKEARRVLVPRGLLIIAEYVRAVDVSPAAQIVEQFLAEFGETRTYERPNYRTELTHANGFNGLDHSSELIWFYLKPEQFAGLALSSSHSKLAVERLGREQASAILIKKVSNLITADGLVPYGYRFESFATERH